MVIDRNEKRSKSLARTYAILRPLYLLFPPLETHATPNQMC